MSRKIKDEQKKFLGETLNQYDKALDEAINQLDKKNREQNHKISSLVNSFDNEYLEKDIEGNMTTLENSKDGMVIINEIQGNTEVNYCKDGEKELILNGDIDTQGESFVTLTEGVNGGLVDVSLEGNTEINLSKTKDPVLVTREFDDINCNAGKLQYTIDDVTTINDEPGKVDIDRIVGDTMVNHAVNGSEELILNAHINESGDNNITLNGVTSDGGKVDVALEGNTLVNVSNVKDDYITPNIEDKVDKGSVISLPEVSEGYINIDSIEGNTLVNYCTDGSKEMTLNGDIDVEGVSVTTTEGMDNGLVDVVCEGNTLVNYLSNYWYKTITYVGCNLWQVGTQIELPFVKLSTEYTFFVCVDMQEQIVTDSEDDFVLELVGGNSWKQKDEDYVYLKDLKIGKNYFKVKATMKDTQPEGNWHTFRPQLHLNVTSGKCVVTTMCLEGNHLDKDLSYFEGMKSVGQDDENGHKIEIVSQNKNLFDGEVEVVGYPRFKKTVNFIKVKPNTAYISNQIFNESGWSCVEEYDNNFNLINDSNKGFNTGNFTTLENTNYVKLKWNEIYDLTNVMVVEGNTVPTAYIPHSSNKKEILLNEPLRGLPSGIKDRFVKIGGKWFIERNTDCKDLVITKGTNWGQIAEGMIGFYDIIDIDREDMHSTEVAENIICDKLPSINRNQVATVTHEGIMRGNTYIGIVVKADNLETQDLDGLKKYIDSLNAKFIYNLATPIYEPLEIEPVLNTYNDTTYISNSSIIPCNMQIKNTGYNAIIKPSTLYTVALDTNRVGTIGINLGGAEVTTTNNVATITTPSTLTDDGLRFSGKNINSFKIMLLEGDRTNQLPNFFEGMKSSFEDKVQEDGSYKMKILMSNKNLVRLTSENAYGLKVGSSYIIHSENSLTLKGTTSYSSIKFKQKLKPLTEYHISCDATLKKGSGATIRVREERLGVPDAYTVLYNSGSITVNDKVHINGTFTTKDVTDVAIYPNSSWDIKEESELLIENLQISEVDGDYVESKHNEIQLSSIEPLRGVGNIHDRLVFKDGKLMIERNCGNYTLDGSADENWIVEGATNKTLSCLCVGAKNKLKLCSQLLHCDTLPVTEVYNKDIEGIDIHSNLALHARVHVSRLTTKDVAGFRQWLQQNPVTVVYQLAEPTYEEIPYDLQKLILESYANGTLFFDTNIPPTKVSFNCFEEELTYLYPATSYTVQFISDKAITVDITLGGTSLLAQNIVKGLNRITMTTPSELVDNKLIISGVGANIREVVVTDTNREFKYFEGMKSVGECEDLEITSSNSDNSLSNKKTLTHEPLRAVGDAKDRYVLIDGKWYIERNCWEYIIPQDTIWTKTNMVSNNGKYTRYYFIMDNMITDQLNASNYENFAISGLLPFGYSNSWGACNRNEIQIINDSTEFYVQLDKTTVEEVASLMNGSKIIYRLKTPVYEEIDYNPLEIYSEVTHITTNSTIPCNIIVKNHGYNLVALKENTQYTLYVNKDTTNALTYRLGDYVEINSLNKFTFTTPSTLTDKTLRIDSKGAKVNDLMLIEGTPINDSIGYFDGLKSSYECEQVTDENDENYGKYKVDIKVVGKNKFDGQWQKNEGIYGVYYYGKGTYTISIQEKDLSLLDNRYSLGHANLDGSNVDWLYSDGTIWRHSRTLTNGKLVFRMPTEEGLELLKRAFDIQIEEGDTATDYEPYFESKQTIYLNSPLLKGDEIVWKDNKIQHYHKMETIVLDGSDDEGWIKQGNDWDTDNRITFKISLPKSNLQWWTLENKISTSQNRMSKKVSSDKFTYIYDIPNENINEFIGQDGDIINFGSSARYLVIGLPKAKLQTQNVTGFKQWLQQNPVKVTYQLAEPTYEEISVYPLKLNVIANSSLSTESTIQVTNISFNVYEETLPYLYSNTKYYITFNADVNRNNIVIDLGGNHVVFDCKVGFNKVEITTPSDTTNLLTFSGTGVNINHVKVTQQDIDKYFEGMKSVGECEELEIVSANSDNTLSSTQTLNHEPLRAVGNVKDKYVLIDNKWFIERNCGEIALENIQWEYNSTITNSGNTFAYTGGISNILVQRESNENYFICNIVKPEKVYNHEVDKEQITQFIHSSAVAIRISRDKLQDNSVNSLNEYLSNNNAKLVYQLKTPVYEPIDYNPFDTYADVTHISTNSLIPSNIVVKNHGYNCILKPSTTYTVALNKSNGTISAKLGGSAKVDSTNSIFTITTPSTLNDNVLRLSSSGNVKDIMILEGDKTVNTPSYFEGIESAFEQEYDVEVGKYRVTARVEGNEKKSSITFYLNEPLRRTSTAKDKVFIQDNKMIVQRNIKEILLNGSENWRYRELRSDGYCYTLDIPDLKKYGINSIKQGYVDRFFMKVLLPFGAFFEYVYGRDICLQLPLALGGDNANAIKDWLNVNNTRVIYELAEPVYEETDCDLSKLVLENYENSSLIFESNIPVSANIRYSGEVPVVTQAKSLSSQVDNTTLDINENIISYMCDIDYRIVELQLMNGDTQGEGIELLGIGDIEILSNENVLFNNREDKKYNYSYDMLKRDILSQRYSREEYQYRLDRYLLAKKISDEEYKELEGLLNNGE